MEDYIPLLLSNINNISDKNKLKSASFENDVKIKHCKSAKINRNTAI